MENDFYNKEAIMLPFDKVFIVEIIKYGYFSLDDVYCYSEFNSQAELLPILVYKCNDKYIVINGISRYCTVRKLKKKNILAIVIPKPEKKMLIFFRLIDILNMRNIVKETIELYINKLIELNESFDTIAIKIERSPSFVRECYYAYLFRQKYREYFNKAGIILSTKMCYYIRKANLEDVNNLIKNIKKNQKKKDFL